MARRSPIEARLAALRGLGEGAPPADLEARVRRGLDDRSSLVVAAAAAVAGSRGLSALAADLEAALERCWREPCGESDPQCHAKLALIEALDRLDLGDDALLLRAARHVQSEPVWGGRQDSATRLRIRAAEVLARRGHPDLFRLLAELLADASHEVRGAAARLAGELGGERAALLLRLRLCAGDCEPENLGDYAAALLEADGVRALPLVLDVLGRRDAPIAAIALALGGSRLPEALDPLRERLAACRDPELRGALATAIALLRSEAAVDCLLELLGGPEPGLARAAAGALALYRDRPAILEQARARVAGTPLARLLPGPSGDRTGGGDPASAAAVS